MENKKRLIDADERMKWLEDNTAEEEWMVNQYNADWIYSMLDSAPTIDAIVLPCKIGDFVWAIRSYHGIKHPQQGKVIDMHFTNEMKLHIVVSHISRGEWGKTVFATREEAEASLAKMDGERKPHD